MQFQHKTYHFPVKQNHRLRLPCGRMGDILIDSIISFKNSTKI